MQYLLAKYGFVLIGKDSVLLNEIGKDLTTLRYHNVVSVVVVETLIWAMLFNMSSKDIGDRERIIRQIAKSNDSLKVSRIENR